MRRTGTGRAITLILAIGLATLVLGCAGIALAIQQRAVEPPELDWSLGPLHLVAMGSHEVMCLGGPDTSTSPCYRYKSVYVPPTYKIWVFTRTNTRSTQRPKLLLHMVLPLREASDKD